MALFTQKYLNIIKKTRKSALKSTFIIITVLTLRLQSKVQYNALYILLLY
jgi:hypothetical protein